MEIFDLQQEFFRPVWLRVTLVVFCFLWAGIEFATNAPFWGMLFGGIAATALWQFFCVDWPSRSAEKSS